VLRERDSASGVSFFRKKICAGIKIVYSEIAKTGCALSGDKEKTNYGAKEDKSPWLNTVVREIMHRRTLWKRYSKER
jgi:hypothetical protein